MLNFGQMASHYIVWEEKLFDISFKDHRRGFPKSKETVAKCKGKNNQCLDEG